MPEDQPESPSEPSPGLLNAQLRALGELRGRTALVTGAGSGIGQGIALELTRAGARVVVVGRRKECLDDTLDKIEAARAEELELGAQASGSEAEAADSIGAARAIVGDVREDNWWPELKNESVEILVNNAAAWATRGPLSDLDRYAVDPVLETGLAAPLRLSQHLLPGMRRTGFGRIVNIGSVAGRFGAAGLASYASAKAGLVGMTTSLAAEEGAHGVTVNLLELGWVETPRLSEKLDPDLRTWFERHTPVGRAGKIEEIAHAVRFLCSPLSGYVTGSTLTVSGGLGLGLYPQS